MTHLLRAEPPPATTGGTEFVLTDKDFSTIATILYADSGISLAQHKRPLVYSRLVKRLRQLGLESFKAYCSLLETDSGSAERKTMLSALTTNTTSFFRELHHFDYLRSHELPPLIRAAREGARVRIWSAACSKGHEPFSIAMTLLSMMPDAEKYDIKILATDIDLAVIQTAQEARYSEEELADVPAADKTRFFTYSANDGIYTVRDGPRRLVSFRELNLLGRWPMRFCYDVIFCRNVAIYFDAETQKTVWTRFAEVIARQGLLCIGHSERLSGPAQNKFDLVGMTMYRHREAA